MIDNAFVFDDSKVQALQELNIRGKRIQEK